MKEMFNKDNIINRLSKIINNNRINNIKLDVEDEFTAIVNSCRFLDITCINIIFYNNEEDIEVYTFIFNNYDTNLKIKDKNGKTITEEDLISLCNKLNKTAFIYTI